MTTLFAVDDAARGAEFSPCGLYRYQLWRIWDPAIPPVLFVMLNPSTADAEQDDPTIRRCIGYAKRWRAGGVRVCNLYGWRATDPSGLSGPTDPVEHFPGWNAHAIAASAWDVGRVIAAWGAWGGPRPEQPQRVLTLLRRRRTVEALALTKAGEPRHPLYVRGDVEPLTLGESSARQAA